MLSTVNKQADRLASWKFNIEAFALNTGTDRRSPLKILLLSFSHMDKCFAHPQTT